jgi:hypothetical protein
MRPVARRSRWHAPSTIAWTEHEERKRNSLQGGRPVAHPAGTAPRIEPCEAGDSGHSRRRESPWCDRGYGVPRVTYPSHPGMEGIV